MIETDDNPRLYELHAPTHVNNNNFTLLNSKIHKITKQIWNICSDQSRAGRWDKNIISGFLKALLELKQYL